MRAIIADDEVVLAQDLQRRLLNLWPGLEIMAVLHDGIAAEKALQVLQPDIAFLDIRMPGMTGLEAARAAKNCRVVFVTAYDQYAVDAFEQAAVDYVLKPVNDERLLRCIDRLRVAEQVDTTALLARLSGLLQNTAAKSEPLRWVRAQLGQSVHMVAVEEVCYFQSDDKYTTVLTRDKEYLLRTPLKELLEQLDPAEFWQVHRSTVVNVRQIASAQHNESGKVTLNLRERREALNVSRSYAHLFRQM